MALAMHRTSLTATTTKTKSIFPYQFIHLENLMTVFLLVCCCWRCNIRFDFVGCCWRCLRRHQLCDNYYDGFQIKPASSFTHVLIVETQPLDSSLHTEKSSSVQQSLSISTEKQSIIYSNCIWHFLFNTHSHLRYRSAPYIHSAVS